MYLQTPAQCITLHTSFNYGTRSEYNESHTSLSNEERGFRDQVERHGYSPSRPRSVDHLPDRLQLIKCWHCVSSAHTFPLYNTLAAQACVEILVHTKTSFGSVASASNVDSVLPCGGRFSTFVLACPSAEESFALKRIISAVNSVACQAQSAIARDTLFEFVQRERVRIQSLHHSISRNDWY